MDVVSLEADGFTPHLASEDGKFRSWQCEPLAHGGGPLETVVVDLNQDGKPDLITANSNASDLTLFYSQDDGSFGQPQFISLSDSVIPYGLAAGAFDNDGTVDLIVGQASVGQAPYGAGIAVLRGDGAGNFVEESTLATCEYCVATQISVPDLNHDGILDIIASGSGLLRSSDGSLATYLGNGDRTFTKASEYSTDLLNLARHALGVINGDGKADVVAVRNRQLESFEGNGDGTLQASKAVDLGSGSYAVGVATGDSTGDGIDDVVTANRRSDDLTLLLSNTDGTQQPPLLVSLGEESQPQEVMIRDVNNDGLNDIIAIIDDGSTLALLVNQGNALFHSLIRMPSGGSPGTTRISGYDPGGDGNSSILVTDTHSNSINLLVAGGDTVLTNTIQSRIGELKSTTKLLNADLNGDSHLDVVTVHEETDDVGVQLGTSDGTLLEAIAYPLPTDAAPQDAVLVDIDGDGNMDLVIASRGIDAISMLRGNGDGSFQEAASIGAVDHPVGIAAGDFDNDGNADIAVAGSIGIETRLGNGDGTLQLASWTHGGANTKLVVGDFNGDGYDDIAGATNVDGAFLLLGSGDGTLTASEYFELRYLPRQFTSADFNGDGPSDLVIQSEADISLFLGDDTGLVAPLTLALPADVKNVLQVVAEDLTGDGLTDVVLKSYGEVFAFAGNGDGTVKRAERRPGAWGIAKREQVHVSIGQRINSSSSLLADFNDDGIVDIAIAHEDTADLSVALGRGDGTFDASQRIELGGDEDVSHLAAADVDADGNIDLLLATPGVGGWLLLPGDGSGGFSDPITYGEVPVEMLTVADLNRDGYPRCGWRSRKIWSRDLGLFRNRVCVA